MAQFAITYDYLCPFARIANEIVVRGLEAGAEHDVTFRPFSLSQVHLEEGETPVWHTEPRPSGVLALEWGLAVRDEFSDAFYDAHLALFSARHDHGRDLTDPDVLREAVASAGLDPEEVAKVVADGQPAKTLASEHTWGVEQHRVFGVPTFVFDERAVFIRLMQRKPEPAEARATLERLLDVLTGWQELNELKATRIPR
ncbi:MAG TPA: DsbA family protein [Actinomycetes bacterium]|jgi:protein-disulfide isomerase-like protein with CxxC motif|nr:DsbA family protein [Actinomycetes bacterium]